MPTKRVVLAEYFTVEDRTLLFIVRDDFDKPEIAEIPVGAEIIQEFVKKYLREKKVESWDEEDEQDYQMLFNQFVAPLVSQSPKGNPMTQEGDIIWLVPHNFLHYLPLHALKVGDRYLIERNPVCYTPSASVMKYCHEKRKQRREKALILADSRGDRLHTQVQGMAIKELFSPHADLYIDKHVTKNLLKQKLRESKADIDILHIACHGEFNVVAALQSGIQLTQGEKLTAEEIFSLEMNADLVTLSACESGINDNKPGDELIGLTRALIYAGTPSVVVSLWEVEEISTSIFMSRFYQKLKMGVNKAESLQQAQLELQRITIQEVIDYCETAKRRVDDPATRKLLDMDIADRLFDACDFEASKTKYDQLRQWFKPDGANFDKEKYDWAKKGASRCNLALQSSECQPINYYKQIYNRLFYWTPFILVGDWR